MNRDRLKDEINKFEWYHSIQFEDDVVSSGRFPPDIPPNYTLFPVFYFLENIDLSGIDCIDIGATDGLASFIIKSEGASTVVATDRGERDAFRFGREILDLDILYFPGTTLDGGDLLRKLQDANLPIKYDLVVLSGVIYHVYDPLIVMMQARNLLKPNGLFIVESAIASGEEDALFLNWAIEEPVREANTYFLPTLKGLSGLMQFCSCSGLSLIRNGRRGAVLGQACSPSEIQNRTDMLKMIIEQGGCYGPLDYKQLERESENVSSSRISYSGMQGELSIDYQMFSTRFQLQPTTEYTGKLPLISQPTRVRPLTGIQPISTHSSSRDPASSKSQNTASLPDVSLLTVATKIDTKKEKRNPSHNFAPQPSEVSISSIQKMISLARRIVKYYSHWPVVLAIIAVILNTTAFLLDEPLQWICIPVGTALVLVLIGHAASKADYALGELDKIQAEQQQAISKLRRKIERLAGKPQKKGQN